MDVLSEVLKAVTLEGAVFYNAEFSAPWGFRTPPSRALAPHVAAADKHVIVFHLLTDGRGSARLEDGEPLSLEAGDIVVFPHGDPHVMENGDPRRRAAALRQEIQARRERRARRPHEARARASRRDVARNLQRVLGHGLRLARGGGGGEVTRFVCGYMTCEPRLSRMVLSGLPPLFKVNIRDDAAGRWLESSIRFSVDEAGGDQPGGEAVLAKLSEVLFVETLRRYVSQWGEGRTGWLAGARDPEVGKALALIHTRPAHPWTLADLGRESGVSRSVLAERFRHFLGQPPMAYLTAWRLQIGARLLSTTSRSVAEIASEVGYESEPAFNRAFKRSFGAPPARFRSRVRAAEPARAEAPKAPAPKARRA
jgi:AraC-like DNA-binding protein